MSFDIFVIKKHPIVQYLPFPVVNFFLFLCIVIYYRMNEFVLSVFFPLMMTLWFLTLPFGKQYL